MPKRLYSTAMVEKYAGPVKRGKLSLVVTKQRFAKTSRFAKMANVEKKEFSTALVGLGTNGAPAAGGDVQCINEIPQGTDIGNRIGRHCTASNVQVIYSVKMPTASVEMDSGFIALVHDSQPDGTVPSFATVFDTSVVPPGVAFKNTLQQRDRFTILWYEQIVSSITTFPAFLGTSYIGKKFTKIVGKKGEMEYASASTVVPSSGALYICCGSQNNSGALSSGSLGYNVNTKLIFTDM